MCLLKKNEGGGVFITSPDTRFHFSDPYPPPEKLCR